MAAVFLICALAFRGLCSTIAVAQLESPVSEQHNILEPRQSEGWMHPDFFMRRADHASVILDYELFIEGGGLYYRSQINNDTSLYEVSKYLVT